MSACMLPLAWQWHSSPGHGKPSHLFFLPSQVLFASHLAFSPNSRVGRPTDRCHAAGRWDLAATWRPAGAAIRAPSPPSHAPPPLARYSATAATGRHGNVNRRRAVPAFSLDGIHRTCILMGGWFSAVPRAPLRSCTSPSPMIWLFGRRDGIQQS